MAMDLGDAKITIKADDKATAQMGKIGKSTGNMTKKFQLAAVAIVAMGVALTVALSKMITSYAEAGDEVAKMAKRTGWGTEALSEMRYVAKIAGTELGSLEKAVKKMSKTILDADRGLETYVRSFEELGLDIKELRAMRPEEQFWTIAYAIGRLADETQRSALAQEIFGRAGTELLPMLAMGKEAIDAYRQKAHDYNVVFGPEAAAAAEVFVDAQADMKTALEGLKAVIAEHLMPALQEVTELFTEKLNKAMIWLSEHPEVIDTFLKLALVFAVGSALYLGIWVIIKAFRALAVAIAIVHAISGVGWAKLLAGAAVAAAAIAAIYAAIGGEEMPEPEEVPSMRYGGIVPGPIGEPIPIIAHGGETFGGVSRAGMTAHRETHIHIGNFMGDELSFRDFARKLQEVMREEERRTAFSGINTGYFFGGSHI